MSEGGGSGLLSPLPAAHRLLSTLQQTRVIMGARGPKAGAVNGTYLLTEQVQNGRPVFRKADGSDYWLWYQSSEKEWWVSDTEEPKDGDKTSGVAYSVETNLADPSQGTRWMVTDGSKFEEQASVVVSYE